jgi:hypothetical protein
MKLDMELIRKLLLEIEDKHTYRGLQSCDIRIDGFTDEEIGYNLQLLFGAGLIEAIDSSACGDKAFNCIIEGITWEGHEFLDAIRDNTVWTRTKEKLGPAIANTALSIIKELALSFCRQYT